ncbi:hypothetical protein AB4571_01810 [Vibrio breoganii]
MSKTKILAAFEVEGLDIRGKQVNLLEVTLSYHKGGHNNLTSTYETGGYYIGVQVAKELPNNLVIYGGFSGGSILIVEAGRFSAKKMDNIAQEALGTDTVRKQVESLINKYGPLLKLKPNQNMHGINLPDCMLLEPATA